MLGLEYWDMAHRAPTIDACFSKAILAFGLSVWRHSLVIPTVIHFAPLLWTRMLRLWRVCALCL